MSFKARGALSSSAEVQIGPLLGGHGSAAPAADGSSLRLTLVIASLAGGGAERVMSKLATGWAERGRSVTLVTFYPESHDFVPLDPRVGRLVIGVDEGAGKGGSVWQNLRRLQRLRRAILASRPDVVISFMDRTNILTLLATRRTRIPVVVSERTDPRQRAVGWTTSLVRRITYRWASAVVVQTSAVRDWAAGFLDQRRVRCIPNPVEMPSLQPAGPGVEQVQGIASSDLGRTVLAMGRLSPEKGFDLLLRAFAMVADRAPEWRLMIVGEGEERDELLSAADALGIADRVELPGWVDAPGSLLREAGLFVLPSRYEGFPNALLEAMACGAAVIAADCPSGPREIVRHGHNGMLVPPGRPEALAEAMAVLIAAPGERSRLGRNARDVVERFSRDRVLEMWDLVLEGARERRNGSS